MFRAVRRYLATFTALVQYLSDTSVSIIAWSEIPQSDYGSLRNLVRQ